MCLSRWNTDSNDDETLHIKLPSISSIDWEALKRVDSQMEEALKQCQQDIGQYEQFYLNLIKEVIEPFRSITTQAHLCCSSAFQIRVLQYESTEKPAFRS